MSINELSDDILCIIFELSVEPCGCYTNGLVSVSKRWNSIYLHLRNRITGIIDKNRKRGKIIIDLKRPQYICLPATNYLFRDQTCTGYVFRPCNIRVGISTEIKLNMIYNINKMLGGEQFSFTFKGSMSGIINHTNGKNGENDFFTFFLNGKHKKKISHLIATIQDKIKYPCGSELFKILKQRGCSVYNNGSTRIDDAISDTISAGHIDRIKVRYKGFNDKTYVKHCSSVFDFIPIIEGKNIKCIVVPNLCICEQQGTTTTCAVILYTITFIEVIQ